MANTQKPKRIMSILGDTSQGMSSEELQKKIVRLDLLLGKVKSRLALRHKAWVQELEKMPAKERALLQEGLSFYNLDSKGLES